MDIPKAKALEIMKAEGIAIVPEPETGFWALTKPQAEMLATKYPEYADAIMCKGYGDDDDWCGVDLSELEENGGVFDDDRQTFGLWV
jgi:hypothetical protein